MAFLWQTNSVPADWSDRRDALPQGSVLRDYTIDRVLGHGGFGIVYRARHNELDQVVAIKEFLPSELAVREGATVRAKSADCETYFADGLRRFREEAKALIDFQQHPSTVACSDFFRANGTAYLVMEYVDGLPLSELLRKREAAGQPFTESDLLAIAVPLAQGLAHIHRAGVIHRDIKPANILVRRTDHQPVLIDFGAAKQAVAEHSRSLAPYTEGYAALEQVAEGQLGPWTDLYGFGAVLWRMVAGGNRPWEPPAPVKVERRANARVREADDPLPSAKDLGFGRFSGQLLEIIDGCLRLRDTERLGDSDRVVQLLKTIGGGDRAPSIAGSQRHGDTDIDQLGPVREGAQPIRSSERRLRKVVAVAAAAIVAAVLAIVALVPRNEGSKIPERGRERGAPEPIQMLPHNEASKTPKRWGFTVIAEPATAVVALLNGTVAYQSGMLLIPGRYEVEVSAPGFTSHREWIWHLGSETLHRVVLEPLPRAESEPVQTPSDATVTPMDPIVAKTEGVDEGEPSSADPARGRVPVSADKEVDLEQPADKEPKEQDGALSNASTEQVVSTTVKTEPVPSDVSITSEPASVEQLASNDQVDADTDAGSESICGVGGVSECFQLGESYRKGEGVPHDTSRAAQFYRLACDGGVAEGCSALGRLYYSGEGVYRDWARAINLHKRACEGADAEGCGLLGTMYANGEGVTLDRVRAAELYKRACDGGVAWGCGSLGHLYRDGWGVRRDRSRAAELYKRACDSGVVWGCSWLGYLYYRGWGVRRSRSRAAELYERGCNSGLAWSCRNLGSLYQKGEGLRRDRSRATDLYSRACEGGDMDGCTWLAWNYYRGVGVAQDRSAAASLLRQACNSDYHHACELRERLDWK